MSIFDRDLDLFHAEGHDVIVCPVAAEEVAAYVGAGNSGVTVRGLFYVRDDLAHNGEVAVEVEQPIFETTRAAAAAAGLAPYTHSIVHADVVYNVVRRAFKDPGFCEFHLEELVQ